MRVGPFAFRYQGNGATPWQYIDTIRKAIDCATTLPLTVFINLIMKLCSRLFVLCCRNCPKDDKFTYSFPILRKLGLRGGVEPWLMACWKACVEFLLSVIELLFLSLTVETLQGKMCQNSLPSGQGRSLGAKILRERVVPLTIYWYHSKANWLRYNFAAGSFYIMKLCSRRFVLYCGNCSKDDNLCTLSPFWGI